MVPDRRAIHPKATLPRLAIPLAILNATLLTPGLTRAQVMEIGVGGAVTTYDRPAVFGPDGVAPLPTVSHAKKKLHARIAAPIAAKPAPVRGADLEAAAELAKLSPELVEAVAWRESRLKSGLVSHSGAVGEMQLMPATARSLNVDPTDSRQNYRGGAAYLAQLMKRYDGDVIRALAAYNAGAGAVDRYGGVPPYKETQAYVAAILERLSQRAEQTDKPAEQTDR